MCGIVGIYRFKTGTIQPLGESLQALSKRGPDHHEEYSDSRVSLGHARLSIIDTSNAASQPMKDSSGRYIIIFNGEIYNYKALKEDLLAKGMSFQNDSDTEVLLQGYIQYGKAFLDKLIGFFAFAIYDTVEESMFIARDRMGIKPLLLFQNEDMLAFASEMKALFPLPFTKEIDLLSLHQYLQLNYIAGPATILKQVRKLMPGHSLSITKQGVVTDEAYYEVPYDPVKRSSLSYEAAQASLRELIDESVKLRLVADVPLGAFLSGGIDSSVVVANAVKYKPDLHTFSIGFADAPYFDETYYANLVAKKFNTQHTVFSLTNDEMFENLHDILDYFDEPFADSSAIAVYILSQKTRKEVTVSLSGDGGDELFGGYNKHNAEFRSRSGSLFNLLVKSGAPIWSLFPQSRSSSLFNRFRQLNRYAEGLKMNAADRYWRWCSFITPAQASSMLLGFGSTENAAAEKRRKAIIDTVKEDGAFDDILLADVQLVLPNDMLTKVDLMSMANSLEVRVPLLDHRIVNFAFGLPTSYKNDGQEGKKILKDAFRSQLPAELFSRPKHGFEVPLLQWFKTGLRSMIEDDLLKDSFVEEQGIFDVAAIAEIKRRLFSANPGDAHAQVWGLLVFQYWWKKYFKR
jgi:asparagine synthase (glutamine-hydrolysing)